MEELTMDLVLDFSIILGKHAREPECHLSYEQQLVAVRLEKASRSSKKYPPRVSQRAQLKQDKANNCLG
ncbi:hypothetical protein SAY86_026373 [Trapa natans]|uniref:Uncharacterized protein n=1 Tax=Trapa natans TaxID=22666 RepID=A0AAN7KAR6_TRANT|nr:hypothetical protein SAY86_026373 [Trapa natans]